MTNREWLSIGLWIVALAIWLIAGIVGSMPWWVVGIVAVGIGLHVLNAVRLTMKKSDEP